MSGFNYAYSLDGSKELNKPFFIPTATVIEKGEIVKFTPGTGIVVATGTDFDDPHLGAAINAHAANSGTELKVSCAPASVFAHKSSNIITATGGSTTTFVVSGLLPVTDDIWIGGYLEVVTCAADSSLVGKKIPITDSTGSGGTITFAAQTAAFASGDTARICPGSRAIGIYSWDIDSDGMNVDWDASGAGEGLQLVDVDPANMTTYWKLRLHQFGNGPAAI